MENIIYALFSIIYIIGHNRSVRHLGFGQFGNIEEGAWINGSQEVQVALKKLKEDASSQDRVKFLQEAAIMAQFNHENIIKFLGIVPEDDHVTCQPSRFPGIIPSFVLFYPELQISRFHPGKSREFWSPETLRSPSLYRRTIQAIGILRQCARAISPGTGRYFYFNKLKLTILPVTKPKITSK